MQPDQIRLSGKDFPYRSSLICYIEVGKDGAVRQPEGQEAYERAMSGKSTLYAVWPGKWRSDLFVIDLDEYARALGVVHDIERTGLNNTSIRCSGK